MNDVGGGGSTPAGGTEVGSGEPQSLSQSSACQTAPCATTRRRPHTRGDVTEGPPKPCRVQDLAPGGQQPVANGNAPCSPEVVASDRKCYVVCPVR